MNYTTVKTYSSSQVITKENVRSLILSKTMLCLGGLILCILLSAFSLIFVKDAEHRVTSDIAKLQHTKETLQIQYSRLLLAENTWAAQQRLQTVAQNHLNMNLPKVIKII